MWERREETCRHQNSGLRTVNSLSASRSSQGWTSRSSHRGACHFPMLKWLCKVGEGCLFPCSLGSSINIDIKTTPSDSSTWLGKGLQFVFSTDRSASFSDLQKRTLAYLSGLVFYSIHLPKFQTPTERENSLWSNHATHHPIKFLLPDLLGQISAPRKSFPLMVPFTSCRKADFSKPGIYSRIWL